MTSPYIRDFTHSVGRALKFFLEALYEDFGANQISFAGVLYINKPIVFRFDPFSANAASRLALFNWDSSPHVTSGRSHLCLDLYFLPAIIITA